MRRKVKRCCKICSKDFKTIYQDKFYCGYNCEMKAGRIRAKEYKKNKKINGGENKL